MSTDEAHGQIFNALVEPPDSLNAPLHLSAPRELPAETPAGAGEHDTLKYHLLGPSLTKAGQDAVDQQKVKPRPPSFSLSADTNVL